MWKFLRRLLFEPVYVSPHTREGEMPDYLTLREIADLPPYHPSCEKRF